MDLPGTLATIKHLVPQESLLVWNIADGWEPLSYFSGKKMPK